MYNRVFCFILIIIDKVRDELLKIWYFLLQAFNFFNK